MTSTKPFSFDTIEDFDDHIAKSIPNYHLLSDTICDLSTFFVQEDTSVVDLGCSTGALLEKIPFSGVKIGIDISSNLLPESHDNVEYIKKDLRAFRTFGRSSLILSIFTLQFMPKDDREAIIETAYDSLVTGGAFIWAEKVQEENGQLEQIQTMTYYDYKKRHFSTQEIMDKERDIRGMLKPNTSNQNLELAQSIGFKTGTLFWKFFNFEAWVFIK